MSPVGDRGSAVEAQCAGTVGLESHIAVALKFPHEMSGSDLVINPMSSSAISLAASLLDCFWVWGQPTAFYLRVV